MLTRNGVVTAIAAAVLLSAAAASGYPELAAFGYAAAVALLAAALWMLAHPKLTVRREISPLRVTAGEAATGILTVTNERGRRCPPITAGELIDGHRSGVLIPSLAGQESHESRYPLPTSRRGVYVIGPLTIGHTDALRLMAITRSYATTSTLYVHPRLDDVRPLPTGQAHDPDGPTSSLAVQGGVVFHSLREYVHGDDWRLVHWKSSARTGRLMVRHNVVPDEARLLIVLDTSTAAYENDDTFEHAVRAAASLCVSGLRAGFPVELRTTSCGETRADDDDEGSTRILDLLAAARRNPGDPGLALLPALLPDRGTVSLGVITGRSDPGLLDLLPRIRSEQTMVSLIQFTVTGDPLPRLAGVLRVTATDPASFTTAWNDLVPA